MTPERWQAVGEIFDQAVALPGGDRTVLINQACGDDAELRSEVLSLVANHNAAAGGFLQHRIKNALSSLFEMPIGGAEPARAGPYRLVRELGRGGMGTVFLAERDDDEYHAKVAVKLVRPGMDTEFILARFRRERQTLARLQHPNICRLLDGGTTDTGLPYIVMEYIEGEWLTEYATSRRLDLEPRLRLFLDVCSAVDYAHRHFIIHRDLKPGNILVDTSGAPKLLDFGICKLTRDEPVPADQTVMVPLTPNYASPEQVLGGTITLVSDVYSLGAVLYELLTGKCPRRFESLSASAIDAAYKAPIVPAHAAAADRQVARRLAGDLDNVMMRALETEPERRYESAAQLAEDLRRYLDHEPVRARPRTIAYRAVKFVRRNRASVAAAAAIVAALAAGLAASAYEAYIARARLQQIRTLSNRLVFDVHDAVRDLPGATRARQTIVQTGLEYLDSSINSAKGDALAEKELAKAYRRLGDVQGNVRTQNLGDPAAANASYRKALALLGDGSGRVQSDIDAETERLILYGRVGNVQLVTGKLADALHTLQDGIRASRSFVAFANADFKAALADLYMDSSEVRRDMADYRAALPDAVESLRLYGEVVAERPADPSLLHSLASAYAAVGMCETSLGKLQDGLAHFRQGTAEMEKLVASDPHNVAWSRDMMLAYGHIGDVLGYPDLQNLGDRAGALQAYRRAAEIGRTLYEVDRADQRAASDYGIVLSRLENTMEEPSLKLAAERESLRVLNEAARISPANGALKVYQAVVNQHLGDSLTARNDVAGARDAYAAAAEIADTGMKSGHASLLVTFILSTRRLALNAVARGHRAEALDFARRALEAGEHPPAGVPPSALPRGRSAMGLAYAALASSRIAERGDAEQARLWFGKAIDAWRAAQASPGWGTPHQREMREVEDALARLRSQ